MPPKKTNMNKPQMDEETSNILNRRFSQINADQDSDISPRRRRDNKTKCMEHGAKSEQTASVRTLCALRSALCYDLSVWVCG